MPRHRHGEWDTICRKCLVACDPTRHFYNYYTQARKPNDHKPEPMLRSEWEAEEAAFVQAARNAIRDRLAPRQEGGDNE